MRNRYRVFVGKGERRNNFVIVGLRERIILKWMFKRWGVIVWIGLIWRMNSSGLLFWNILMNLEAS